MDAFFDKTSRHRRKVDPTNTPCARNIQCIIIIARCILYIPPHDVFDPRWLRGFHLHGRHRGSPRPYTSSHRSSNALIIKPETCPKNFAEMATCRGFAKAKMISYLTRVDSFPLEAFTTGSNFQVVSRVLNRGVEDDATALREWIMLVPESGAYHKGQHSLLLNHMGSR